MNSVFLLVFMISWLASTPINGSQAEKSDSLPDYKDFSAGEVFHGQPAEPILVTAQDKSYRTALREGARKGPDFAGHYTIVEWGEGSSVITFAVVDAISGKVFHNPFGPIGFPWLGAASGRSYNGLRYRLDSSLLVIDGCPYRANPDSKAGTGACGTYYYNWEKERFVHLRSVAVPEAKN